MRTRIFVWQGEQGIRLRRRYPHSVLAEARSRSRENNTQLFSNTLAPLRYLTSELADLRSGYVHSTLVESCQTRRWEYVKYQYGTTGRKLTRVAILTKNSNQLTLVARYSRYARRFSDLSLTSELDASASRM